MVMLPTLRIGAPPTVPGATGSEEGAAPDQFAQLLELLPAAAAATVTIADPAKAGIVPALLPGGPEAEDKPDGETETSEDAVAMFLPTLVPAQVPVVAQAEFGVAPSATGRLPAEPSPAATGPDASVLQASATLPTREPRVPGKSDVQVGRGDGRGETRRVTPPLSVQASAPAVPAAAASAPKGSKGSRISEPLRAALQAIRAAAPAPAEKFSRSEASPPEAAAPTAPTAPTVPVQHVQPAAFGQDQAAAVAMAEALAQPAAAEPLTALPREPAGEAVERQLDVSADGEWLDQLARDIVRTGASGGEGGALRFRLNPETLGQIRIEVSQGAEGATIRIAAETDAARALLADAQPRLAAEARAQGVRIAETEVSLAGSGSGSADPQRRESAQAAPLLRTGAADAHGSSEESARTSSDRYA